MSTALRFLDHPAYHRTFVAMTAGAALGGGGAAAAGLPAAPLAGGVAGALLGLGWAVRRGSATPPMTVRRALLVLAAVAAAAACAVWASAAVAHAEQTASLPGWLTGALAGAAVGLGGTLAVALRHVAVVVDPVAAAYRALPPLSGEARDLVERGRTIWLASDGLTIPGDADRDLVQDGVLKLFGVARKLAATPAIDPSDIDRRITELDARIETVGDDVARAQYRDARAALCDQRRYVDQVGAARERIVARMHHCVATLEKFRMACAQLDAAA